MSYAAAYCCFCNDRLVKRTLETARVAISACSIAWVVCRVFKGLFGLPLWRNVQLKIPVLE